MNIQSVGQLVFDFLGRWPVWVEAVEEHVSTDALSVADPPVR